MLFIELILFTPLVSCTQMCQKAALGSSNIKVDEVCLPVRKSKTHLHREVFNPRASSFVISLEGTMVLNTEL